MLGWSQGTRHIDVAAAVAIAHGAKMYSHVLVAVATAYGPWM